MSEQKPKKLTLLRYPERSIGRKDDYMIFTILRYNAPGLGAVGLNALPTSDDNNRGTMEGVDQSANIVGSIVLPMPKGISDALSCGWGANELNSLSAAGVGAVQSLMNNGGFGQTIGDILGDVNKQLADETAKNSVQAATAGLAVNALTGGKGDITGLVSRATGQIVNPNVELLFNGVQLRGGFNFTFDLIPRNASEGEQIRKIIRLFKKSMLPSKTGGSAGQASGFFVKSPNVFRINYMQGSQPHPFLNKFKVCALTNMSTDYAASGEYSSYHNSTPVHMRLTMSFQELSPVYTEDYDNDDTGVGF
jgi:hypothetical protein